MSFAKFFSGIQETPWYHDFLHPVVQEVEENAKMLDIGTGSGKLLQLLWQQRQVKAIGVDTSASMLKEAKNKIAATDAAVLLIKAHRKLPFKSRSFDHVTICNVLFNLPISSANFMLEETQRVVRKGGKIVVLTPTGKGTFLSLKKYFFPKNLSFFLWFYLTRRRGKIWMKQKRLLSYALKHNFQYKQQLVFDGFAQLEVLVK